MRRPAGPVNRHACVVPVDLCDDLSVAERIVAQLRRVEDACGHRAGQGGRIDVLYTFMAVKRQPEVEHSLARIGEALYRRQG